MAREPVRPGRQCGQPLPGRQQRRAQQRLLPQQHHDLGAEQPHHQLRLPDWRFIQRRLRDDEPRGQWLRHRGLESVQHPPQRLGGPDQHARVLRQRTAQQRPGLLPRRHQPDRLRRPHRKHHLDPEMGRRCLRCLRFLHAHRQPGHRALRRHDTGLQRNRRSVAPRRRQHRPLSRSRPPHRRPQRRPGQPHQRRRGSRRPRPGLQPGTRRQPARDDTLQQRRPLRRHPGDRRLRLLQGAGHVRHRKRQGLSGRGGHGRLHRRDAGGRNRLHLPSGNGRQQLVHQRPRARGSERRPDRRSEQRHRRPKRRDVQQRRHGLSEHAQHLHPRHDPQHRRHAATRGRGRRRHRCNYLQRRRLPGRPRPRSRPHDPAACHLQRRKLHGRRHHWRGHRHRFLRFLQPRPRGHGLRRLHGAHADGEQQRRDLPERRGEQRRRRFHLLHQGRHRTARAGRSRQLRARLHADQRGRDRGQQRDLHSALLADRSQRRRPRLLERGSAAARLQLHGARHRGLGRLHHQP